MPSLNRDLTYSNQTGSRLPGQTEKPSTPEKPTRYVQRNKQNVEKLTVWIKEKTAAVVGVKIKKQKRDPSVTIAKTVKINGVTYKVTKIGKNAFRADI